jgi:hypothetical protein
VLGLRDLNRTLLARQHLLERTSMTAIRMVEHLLGLQAQDNLPPYLALAARIDGFQPAELSAALEARGVVRLVTMRGTIHVLTPDDALALRPWVQPSLDQVSRSNQQNKPARGVPLPDVVAATRKVLSAEPLPVKQLGERLAEIFPGVPGSALAHLAREHVPLVQLPPRGLWRRSGGVVYRTVEDHLGRPLTEVDVRELVRRYLRAFGPATPADMTAWSRVTRLTPVFEEMADRDELEVVDCADGRKRYDVPGAPRADGDEPAPVRLLGTYDNVFLSHADRSHIVPEAARTRWMGLNGGLAHTVFVDGFMAGLWRNQDGKVEPELFVKLTRAQRTELDEEVARTEALLAS